MVVQGSCRRYFTSYILLASKPHKSEYWGLFMNFFTNFYGMRVRLGPKGLYYVNLQKYTWKYRTNESWKVEDSQSPQRELADYLRAVWGEHFNRKKGLILRMCNKGHGGWINSDSSKGLTKWSVLLCVLTYKHQSLISLLQLWQDLWHPLRELTLFCLKFMNNHNREKGDQWQLEIWHVYIENTFFMEKIQLLISFKLNTRLVIFFKL
jgi:hypothetical protein